MADIVFAGLLTPDNIDGKIFHNPHSLNITVPHRYVPLCGTSGAPPAPLAVVRLLGHTPPSSAGGGLRRGAAPPK